MFRNVASSVGLMAPLGAMRSAAKAKPGAFRLMMSEVWQSPLSVQVLRVVRVVVAQAMR